MPVTAPLSAVVSKLNVLCFSSRYLFEVHETLVMEFIFYVQLAHKMYKWRA